jgi:hypothetical protein
VVPHPPSIQTLMIVTTRLPNLAIGLPARFDLEHELFVLVQPLSASSACRCRAIRVIDKKVTTRDNPAEVVRAVGLLSPLSAMVKRNACAVRLSRGTCQTR